MKLRPLWALCFVLSACAGGDSAGERLRTAETLVVDYPDSALPVLTAAVPHEVRPERLCSSALRARRALLCSEAWDRSGVDIEEDSLIRIAVGYYAGRGPAESRAKAYYYQARVFEDSRELDTAVKSLIRAEELAASSDNFYLRGLIAESFGRLYLSQYHLEEAETYYRQAIEWYDRCGRRRNAGACYNQLAKIVAIGRRFDEAVTSYRTAMAIFRELGDTTNLLRTSGMLAGWHLRRTNDAVTAKRMLKEGYACYSGDTIPAADYYLWSVLYVNDDNLDSARYFAALSLHSATDSYKRKAALFLLKDIEKIAGRYRDASAYCEQCMKCTDSVYAAEREQEVQRLTRRYRNELLKANNEKLRLRNRYQIVIGSLVVVLSLFVGARILRRRRMMIERQRLLLTQYSRFVESLKESYGDMKSKYEELGRRLDREDEVSTRILASFKNRLEGLKTLIDNAWLYERKPALFYEEFKKYVIINPNAQYAFSDIQYVVNKTCFGVIDYLRKNYPDLTGFDLDLCSLLCFGFSQNGIRMIYEHKNNYSLYNKRSRLRKKLGLQAGEQIEHFLRTLIIELGRHQCDDVE